MRLIIQISMVALALATWNHDFMWPKWLVLQLLGAGALAYFVGRRYGWIPALCVLWPLIGAITVFADRTPATGGGGPQFMAVDLIAIQASLCLVLTVVGVGGLKPAHQKALGQVFGFLCFSDSLFVLAQRLLLADPSAWGGLLGNPSMNGTFIAATWPWLAVEAYGPISYGRKSTFTRADYLHALGDMVKIAIPVVAVFLTGQSVPVGTLAVVVVAYILVAHRRVFLAFLFFSALTICGLVFIPGLTVDSGRFQIWGEVTRFWLKNGDLWTGAGNGQFFLLGPAVQHKFIAARDGWTLNAQDPQTQAFIQQLFVNPGDWWWWAHNDWLQTWIELGHVGLFLYFSLFVWALRVAWVRGRHTEFACLAGLGAAACFNFLVHNAMFAVLIVVTVARVFDRRRTD